MGDDDEEIREPLDVTQLGRCGDLGGVDDGWPSSARMDVIGRNGNDGHHYDDCCPRHSEEEEDDD